MKKINIALIFIFLLSACTPQADLSVSEDDGEILGVEATTQSIEEPEPEVIKRIMETKNAGIEAVSQ